MAGALLFRVNEQPPILQDMSESEFYFLLGGATVIGTVASCILFSFLWQWKGGLVLTIVVTPLLTRSSMKRLAKMKLDKPENYYPLLIKLQIDRCLDWVFGTHLAYAPGPWSVIRRNRFEGGQ